MRHPMMNKSGVTKHQPATQTVQPPKTHPGRLPIGAENTSYSPSLNLPEQAKPITPRVETAPSEAPRLNYIA